MKAGDAIKETGRRYAELNIRREQEKITDMTRLRLSI